MAKSLRVKTGELDHTSLPARFQIGETVSINLFDAGFIRKAEVIKIHFAEGKVMYTVQVCVSQSPAGEEHNMYTRLHNIDSVFIKDFVH